MQRLCGSRKTEKQKDGCGNVRVGWKVKGGNGREGIGLEENKKKIFVLQPQVATVCLWELNPTGCLSRVRSLRVEPRTGLLRYGMEYAQSLLIHVMTAGTIHYIALLWSAGVDPLVDW